jgi:hypothetical protein
MASSTGTFIVMVEQFLSELTQCFPNEPKIKKFVNSFDILKKSNPKKILDLFMDKLSPYQERIMNKDETLMDDDTIALNNELNLKSIWNTPGITENTKNAIWSHLHSILMFGTTLRTIPSELMNSIESLAADYANKVNPEDIQDIDPAMLLASMQKMLKFDK